MDKYAEDSHLFITAIRINDSLYGTSSTGRQMGPECTIMKWTKVQVILEATIDLHVHQHSREPTNTCDTDILLHPGTQNRGLTPDDRPERAETP